MEEFLNELLGDLKTEIANGGFAVAGSMTRFKKSEFYQLLTADEINKVKRRESFRSDLSGLNVRFEDGLVFVSSTL